MRFKSLSKRSQSALEYMMTYGWAILIIVVVAVILYSMGIFNPSLSVTKTSIGFSPFAISSAVCSKGGLTIALTAGGLPDTASSATITKLYISSNTGTTAVTGRAYEITPVTLSPGQSAIITIPAVACTSVGISFSLSAMLQYNYSTTLGNVVNNATGIVTGTSSAVTITSFSAYGLPSNTNWIVSYDGFNKTNLSIDNISFGSLLNSAFKIFPVKINSVTYYPIYSSGPSLEPGYDLQVDFIPNSTPIYLGQQGGPNITIFYPSKTLAGMKNITLSSAYVGTSGLAVTPNGGYIYATEDNNANTTTIISTSTDSIVKNLSLTGSCGVAITPNGQYAYISRCKSNETSVISTSNNDIISNITVPSYPIGVAITPNGQYAYVACHGANKVSVISVNTNKVIYNLSGFDEPTGVVAAPDGLVYVSDPGSYSIAVINSFTNSIIDNIPLPISSPPNVSAYSSPRAMALSPNGEYLYISNGNGAPVSVISTNSNSVIATIHIPFTKQLSFTPNGKYLYVTTPYAYPYALELIYTSNNTYINVTPADYPANVCSINDGPIGTSGEC